MCVAKEVGEMYRVVDQLAISLGDFLIVGIGNDASAMVDNLNPFGLWPKDDARFLEKESLFLHTATIGHNDKCVLLKHIDFEERSRRDDSNLLA